MLTYTYSIDNSDVYDTPLYALVHTLTTYISLLSMDVPSIDYTAHYSSMHHTYYTRTPHTTQAQWVWLGGMHITLTHKKGN